MNSPSFNFSSPDFSSHYEVEDDYDFATETAYSSIFEDEDDTFDDILAFIRSNCPSIVSESDKQDLIESGKNYVQSNGLLDLRIKNLSIDEIFSDSIDDESFVTFSSEKEKEVDFSNPQLMKVKAMDDFRTIRRQISNDKIDHNFTRSKCSDYLKDEIQELINRKINNNELLSVEQALQLIKLDKKCIVSLFEKGFDKFFSHNKRFNRVQKFESLVNRESELYKVLSYNDNQVSVKYGQLPLFCFVYAPSGGGKTRQFKDNNNYRDVDKICEENYSLFLQVQEFVKQSKEPGYMNLFFKYCITKDIKKFAGKITLMNHPNQVPNCLRNKFNELIIIPQQFNWQIRHFSENLFSLLSCINYRKVMLRYDQYKSFIESYFHYFIKFLSVIGNQKMKDKVREIFKTVNTTETISSRVLTNKRKYPSTKKQSTQASKKHKS